MFWADDNVSAVQGAQYVSYELAFERRSRADEELAPLPDGLLVDRRRKTVEPPEPRRRRLGQGRES